MFSRELEALIIVLPLFGFPDTSEKCEQLSREFKTSRSSLSPLDGCVGDLDVIVIRISKPANVVDPAHYFNRKGYFALTAQAVCASDYRFIFMSVRCAITTHYSAACTVSSFAQRLASGTLLPGFWIAGDDAYMCTETLITPVPSLRAASGSAEDCFKYHLSSLRVHIEQASGLLIAIWGIFSDLYVSHYRSAHA